MVRNIRDAVRILARTALIAALAAVPAAAQSSNGSDADRDGVVGAALDYMEGALNADADRVGRGVHTELTKVIVGSLPRSDRQTLSYSGYSGLVETVRGLGDRLADVDKGVEVTVFDIGDDLAAARAVGAVWYDFLQLAKINGEWKIVNVLWARNRPDAEPQPGPSATDSSSVERAALDYIEGSFSGDAERMQRALHPELTKVLLTRHPQTGEPFLYRMGASNLIEGTRAGLGTLDEESRNIDVEIYDISHDIAAVKVSSAMYIDHLQIARVNGEWKIINVLWVPNPDAPRPNR